MLGCGSALCPCTLRRRGSLLRSRPCNSLPVCRYCGFRERGNIVVTFALTQIRHCRYRAQGQLTAWSFHDVGFPCFADTCCGKAEATTMDAKTWA